MGKKTKTANDNDVPFFPVLAGVLPSIEFGDNDEDFGLSCSCPIHSFMSEEEGNLILIDYECPAFIDVMGYMTDALPVHLRDGDIGIIAEHAESLIAWHMHGFMSVFGEVEFDVDPETILANTFNVTNLMLVIRSAIYNEQFDKIVADCAKALEEAQVEEAGKTKVAHLSVVN
jgi:hypothetical protein